MEAPKPLSAAFSELRVVARLVAKLAIYIFLFFVAITVCVLCAPYVFPESSWAYELSEDVNTKNVHIQAKPHDCDWSKAPIGDKECHFKRIVEVETIDNKREVFVSWEKVQE